MPWQVWGWWDLQRVVQGLRPFYVIMVPLERDLEAQTSLSLCFPPRSKQGLRAPVAPHPRLWVPCF